MFFCSTARSTWSVPESDDAMSSDHRPAPRTNRRQAAADPPPDKQDHPAAEEEDRKSVEPPGGRPPPVLEARRLLSGPGPGVPAAAPGEAVPAQLLPQAAAILVHMLVEGAAFQGADRRSRGWGRPAGGALRERPTAAGTAAGRSWTYRFTPPPTAPQEGGRTKTQPEAG